MWGMKSRGRSLFARACGLLQASQGHVEGLPPASLSQRQYHQSIERRDLSFSRGSAGGAGEDEGAQAKTEAGAAAATSADEEMVKSVVPVPGGEGADERETWGGKVDFLLSVIGFAVDLANVWRFPYLCYKNGGGAFLIPYGVMLIVGGIPLFYMELALGQFHRRGAITCWGRLVPLLKGIGYSVVLIAFYVDFYYNVIIAWSLRYFVSSFTSVLPWTSCDNSWNTPLCEPFALSLTGEGNSTNTTEFPKGTKFTSAAAEYFTRNVLELHMSNGLDDAGKIKWDLALCLLAVYLICYFSLWKGVSTSGKVVWFTALFPYCVLLCLFIRGVTLPGSAEGIRYYLNPNFDVIAKAEVWVDAATQVFYSLGPGFGVLLAYASYNEFHNNVYQDALVTSVINSLTSFIAGFVIFSVLGYMSYASGRSIEDVATEGPGLVFMVYPAAIATMPGSVFWSLMFFMMLLTLGLDSSFGGSEAIITALSDEFPVISRHREIFVALLFIIYYLVGLWSCAQGGFYFFQLLDKFAAGYSILIAVFFESIAISWIYGTDRFCEDLKNMIGFYPGIYWRLCWRYVAPIFLIFITVYGLSVYTPLTYEDYVYPEWANAFGWCIAGSSVAMIPIVAIYKLITTPGTFMERMKILTTPWCDPHPIPANGNAGTPGDGSTGTPGGKAGGTGAPSPVDASDQSSPTSPSKTKPKPAEKATSPHQPAPKSTVVSVAPTGHPATAKTVTSPVSPIGERSSSQEMYREPPKDVKRRVSNTPTGPEAV